MFEKIKASLTKKAIEQHISDNKEIYIALTAGIVIGGVVGIAIGGAAVSMLKQRSVIGPIIILQNPIKGG